MREDDLAVSFLHVQIRLDGATRRAAAKQVIQEEHAILFCHVKRKWFADHPISRAPEKLRCRNVDLFNSTDTVETDISDRREVEKINAALNGRLQFRLGMPEDWRAIFRYLSISRNFPGRARPRLDFFHDRMN